jgi:glyoxylase-like metal-dependent hydrolase (beta-lactamase superfamily II)
MFGKKLLPVLFVISATAAAQAPQGQRGGGAPGGRGGGGAARGGATVEKIQQIKPNLYMVPGGGANSVIRVTPEGLILIDTKNPGDELYNALVEQIKSVSNLPVKYVINTHHHPDHVGNNQKFIDSGAQVIGLEALKTAMASDQRTAQIPGRPTVTFAKDYVLKFGGAEVQAHHYGRGHTIDDTIVYFPDAKVVMVSDQITDGAPLALFAEGGSIVEWRQSLEAVLKLDFDTAIPGRGDPRPKAAIQAYKEKWDTVISRVNDAIKGGATKDQLAAQVKLDDIGWQLNAQVLGGLYDELKK